MKKHTRKLALLVAAAAVCLLPAEALAAPVSVTVRIEGAKHELLDRTVKVSSGTITRGGHSCPAQSAAGALNLATGGRWSGSWYSGLGFSVTTILGESYPFTKSDKAYWELFTGHVSASQGICATKLTPGEQLLFAPAPVSGAVYPLALVGPSRARVGRSLKLRVIGYDAKGRAKPLAGATVTGGGLSFTANGSGYVVLKPSRAGSFTFLAVKKGYIRAPLSVKVTK